MLNMLLLFFQDANNLTAGISAVIAVISTIVGVISWIRKNINLARIALVFIALSLIVLTGEVTYLNFFKPHTLPIPALVNQNFNGQYPDSLSNSPISNSVAFPKDVSTGDLIFVAITQYQGEVTQVSDNQHNHYVKVAEQIANTQPDNDYVELYYAKNVKGGATKVTVMFSRTGDTNVGIYEFSHINTLDFVAQHTGAGNAPNGGTLSTSNDQEVYFVVGVDDDNNPSSTENVPPKAGSGYTLVDHADDSMSEKFYAEYRVAPHGSYLTNFSIPIQSNWAVIGASFK